MDILSILKTFGIEANNEDINAIIELREIEDEHLPVLQETAADLQAQLDLVQADIEKATSQIASYKARIGTLKASTTRSSGLPLESNEHRSRKAATLYFLRERATVEPVHRGEISQYVFGDRMTKNLSRVNMVLNTLKRKGLVRNGPRGYWFPL